MTHGINTGAPPADESATVFIGPEDVLARWDGRTATPNDLLAFADSDAQHALDVI